MQRNIHSFSFIIATDNINNNMDQTNRELLVEKHWALHDVELIRISATHRCIRKLYMLEENGYTDVELDVYPCKRYDDLEWKYQRSFQYCKHHIHKLNFNPKKYSPECSQILPLLNDFIVHNDIELVLYKGGTIERDMCRALDISSLNIECFDKMEKAYCHDPRREVNCYFSQLNEIISE